MNPFNWYGLLGSAILGALVSWYITSSVVGFELQKARNETLQCQLHGETSRADANAGVVKALTDSSRNALDAAHKAEDERRAAEARFNKFFEAISHAPHTKVCVGTPAFRALFDSVRNEGTGSQ